MCTMYVIIFSLMTIERYSCYKQAIEMKQHTNSQRINFFKIAIDIVNFRIQYSSIKITSYLHMAENVPLVVHMQVAYMPTVYI